MEVFLFIMFIILVTLPFLAFGGLFSHGNDNKAIEEILHPERRAGKRGEEMATGIIRDELNEEDILLTNVEVVFQDKEAELDNVIINKYGVFIIEVKYYSGELAGDEDDYEWEKYHQSEGGCLYVKDVKNPIRQVRRQTWVLANYLRSQGIDVWVRGYVIMLGNNCPVDSEYVLTSRQEIREALHRPDRRRLSMRDIDAVVVALKFNGTESKAKAS